MKKVEELPLHMERLMDTFCVIQCLKKVCIILKFKTSIRLYLFNLEIIMCFKSILFVIRQLFKFNLYFVMDREKGIEFRQNITKKEY